MQHDPLGYDLVGNADFYVKDKILVELKYTAGYQHAHMIQLLIYAYCLNVAQARFAFYH
jgi:hypothetical protein